MAKIFVGLPTYKTFQDLSVRKKQDEIFKSSPHQILVQEVNGMNIEQARQIAIDSFLKTNAEYFLNVDSDIIPFKEGECPIDKLVKCDKDIVGGIYFFRAQPCQPVYRPTELQEIYEKTGKFPEKFDWNIPKELFPVTWMGNGFKLVKRNVVEDVRKGILIPNLPMIYKNEYLGEDWAFDQRARDLGYSVWADPTIKLGHVGNYIYTAEDFKK